MICAQLFGRMCTNELPRWTSVDERIGRGCTGRSPVGCGSVAKHRAQVVIERGVLVTEVNIMWTS